MNRIGRATQRLLVALRIHRGAWWRKVVRTAAICGLATIISGPHPVLAQETPVTVLTDAELQRVKESESYWKAGYELINARKYAEATPQIVKAIKIERGVYEDGHDRVLEILNILAELHELQDQFAESAAIRSERLAMMNRRFGPMHWRAINARIEGEESQIRGRLTSAERQQLREAAGASKSFDTLYAAGKFAEALVQGQFVVQQRRTLLGENNSTFALSLAKLALVQSSLGNFQQAESFYLQALDIERQTIGEQHPEYATTLSNLAVQYDSCGEFAKAQRCYQQALQIRREALGEQHSDYATSLNNFASHYERLGDFEQAETLYAQAVEIKRLSLGETHADYMTSLNNLGRHLQERGELERAEPLLIRAMELRKKALGEQHPQYAGSLNNLGLLYEARKDFDRADECYRQSLQILKQRLGELHPNYATVLGHLADLQDVRGEFSTGESLHRQVLELQRRSLGNYHPKLALACSGLGLNLLHQQQHEPALILAREATRIDRYLVDAAEVILSDRQQFLMARQSRATLDVLLSILVESGNATDPDYNEMLQAKGRVWQRQRLVRALAAIATDHPELSKIVTDLKGLTANRARLLLNPPRNLSPDELDQQIRELTRNLEAREQELSEKSEGLRAAQLPITPEVVRQSLPQGTVLVDFLEYLHPSKPPIPSGSSYERRLLAFVLRRDVPGVVLIPLGRVHAVAKDVEDWRKSFENPAELLAVSRRLKQKIWEPLEPHLKGATTVLVSPDGVLGQFPFGALPGREPDTYLLEDVSLAVVPCAMAIPATARPGGTSHQKTRQGNLLLVANIDYDAMSQPTVKPVRKPVKLFGALRSDDWKGFTPLPGTRGEEASIEKTYREAFGNEGITVLEGADARETRVCDEATRHRYLHIATHGFFAPAGLTSALHSRQEYLRSSSMSAGSSSQFMGYPPGLLSGLALAGANHDPDSNDDDGILTAAEVENLDLHGMRLAVLSACETGLGEAAGGEGLLGLQRGFQVAGTRTVVASLWQVSDTATRSLMERFYSNHFEKQMSPLEALREAQLWMMHDKTHRGLVRLNNPQAAVPARTAPFYWAAFVLSGDWR